MELKYEGSRIAFLCLVWWRSLIIHWILGLGYLLLDLKPGVHKFSKNLGGTSELQVPADLMAGTSILLV